MVYENKTTKNRLKKIICYFFEKENKFNWLSIATITFAVFGSAFTCVLLANNFYSENNNVYESVIEYKLSSLNDFKSSVGKLNNAMLNLHVTYKTAELKREASPILNSEEEIKKYRKDFGSYRQEVITSLSTDNKYIDDVLNELDAAEKQLSANANSKIETLVIKDATYFNYVKEENKNIEKAIN